MEFRISFQLAFSSFGSQDMYDCILEKKSGQHWKPVFSTQLASEYEPTRSPFTLYMHRDKSELILQIEAPPTSDASQFEDHGRLSTGGADQRSFAYWISHDEGETWSVLHIIPGPDRRRFRRLVTMVT